MSDTNIYLIIIMGVGIGIFILCREFFCWYFKITEVSNSLKKISESISSSNTEEVRKIAKQVLYEERECSLTNIYDEDQLTGHEWNQFVSEGHWVKMIYDEKREKFTVKHYRTDKNLEKNGKDSRIKEELNYNIEHVFGNLDDKGRKKTKHIPLSKKIEMRK